MQVHWPFCSCLCVLVVIFRGIMLESSSVTKKVVVLGAGIQGASVAYYLSRRGISSVIVESDSIASAASGKAGGFLARNGGSGPTKQLHETSFDLHVELSTELNVESFRRIPTLEVIGKSQGGNLAPWLDRKVTSSLMDSVTAQVTPKELTEKFIEYSLSKGSELLIGTVSGVNIDPIRKAVTGVYIENVGLLEAENIVVCMGPWSGVACEDWFGLSIPLNGIKSSSIIFKDIVAVDDDPFACFCAEDAHGCHLELYATHA